MKSSIDTLDGKISEVFQPFKQSAYGRKLKETQRRIAKINTSLVDKANSLDQLNFQMKNFEEQSLCLKSIIRKAENALEETSQCESNTSLQQAYLILQVSLYIIFMNVTLEV